MKSPHGNQSDFFDRVYALVRGVPSGKVVTYGYIAAMLGSPRAARAVGMALRRAPADVPWHRVIASTGRISIENMDHPAAEQAALLRREGIVISSKNDIFSLKLARYLWKK